jgi:glycine oxidase
MKITIRGAGIIGLSCADELVRRGHTVTVVDPAPGSGASHAAAGMLAPSAEVWWSEAALLELGLGSLEPWPVFASRMAVTLTTNGTILAARAHGGRQQVERQLGLLSEHGRPAGLLARTALTMAPCIPSATSWVNSTETSSKPAASSPATYSPCESAPAMQPT